MTGQAFEFDTGDALGYHQGGEWIRELLLDGNIASYFKSMNGRYSDAGYMFWLGLQYVFTCGSILIARLIKAFLSAYMCVLIYRLAKRNFGEEVGKMSAVFAMLLPHFIYYCGMHLKETEMVFLVVWFLERIDYVIREKKFSVLKLALPLLLLSSLFFFRTVLGMTAAFAVATTALFSDSKIINKHKRLQIITWGVLAVSVFLGGTIANEIEGVFQLQQGGKQQLNMEWRSQREGGNSLAKYAGATVFAPLIFTIPFPTVVNIDKQENQMMVNGNNYIKNILSFFVILSFVLILKQKRWRHNLLLISFLVTYLVILAFSEFAQSERFHMPVLPVYIIFVAYGISQVTNAHKRYYTYWLVFMLIAIIAWSWFKLAGRGLV